MLQIIINLMKTSGLTEKRMQNRRFFKNEHAIFVAYYKLKDYPSAKKLAKIAGVSRSTLYRHHKRVQSIPADCEEYLLQNYFKTIKKLLEKNPNFRVIFLRTLVFIRSNKELFKILFKDNHKEIIKRMINHLKTVIVKEWHLSGDVDTIFNIYANEVLGVIEIWHKHYFSDKFLESTLSNILFLTKTSRRSLLPLQQSQWI